MANENEIMTLFGSLFSQVLVYAKKLWMVPVVWNEWKRITMRRRRRRWNLSYFVLFICLFGKEINRSFCFSGSAHEYICKFCGDKLVLDLSLVCFSVLLSLFLRICMNIRCIRLFIGWGLGWVLIWVEYRTFCVNVD